MTPEQMEETKKIIDSDYMKWVQKAQPVLPSPKEAQFLFDAATKAKTLKPSNYDLFNKRVAGVIKNHI